MGLVKSRFARIGLFVILTSLFAVVASAQFRAGVQGVVTDNGGGVVPGATVILTNKETNQTQRTETSDDGFYRFSNLAPGLYSLSAEKQDFKKGVTDNVKVDAEAVNGVDLVLEAGVISETVTVEAGNVGLQTEDGSVRKTIDTSEIRSLPQTGRDPFELLRLSPGVFGDSGRSGNGNAVNLPNTPGPGGSNNTIFQSENQPQISAAGQRVTANNFQLDGVSINSLQQGGASVITPNQESVREILVSSSSFSAEDGRNSGLQVRVVSQNGTNDFHGSAFFKYNDPGWNAFNKFRGIPGSTVALPQRVENRYKTFGGTLGGPVVKNKLFFFGSYEGLRNSSNSTYEAFIETAQYRQQVIAARPGGVTARILQLPGIEPRIATLLPRTCVQVFGGAAAARCRDVAGGLDIGSITGTRGTYLPFGGGVGQVDVGGGFDGIPDIAYALLNQPTIQTGNQYNFRIDFNPNSKNLIAFSSYITTRNDRSVDTGSRSRPSSDVIDKPLPYVITGVWIYNLTGNLVNEFRSNFTSFKSDQVKASADTNFGIPNLEVEGLPFDRIRFGRARGETTPAIFSQKTVDISDALTTAFGNHAVKLGASFRREFNDNELSGGARPLYSFVGLFNLANDTPIFEAINADPTTGAPANAKRELRSNNISFFVQDDWKAMRNLTLNFGLRYEYFSPLTDKGDRLTNLELGSGAQTLTAARVVSVKSLNDPDKNNFAPRIGFAYSPNQYKMLDGKAVFRGGFGVYYNRIPSVVFANAAGNPPFFARYNICCGTAATDFGSPFAGGQILYAVGSSNAADSYPINPVLGLGIDPATGLPRGPSVEIYGSRRDIPNATVYKYSLGLQYELPYQILASVGYEGNQSRNLIRLVNQNFLFPANPKIFAAYFATPDVSASYDGMNVTVERRFADNFQAAFNYRFSKSLDNLSNEGPGGETNQTFPIDNAQEKGPSDYDVRHNFNLSGLYSLPSFFRKDSLAGRLVGGFEIGGIVTYHTGFPWTPKVEAGIRGAGGDFFGPVRPIQYLGGVQQNTSNNSFLQPNGYFTGGGSRYFRTTLIGDPPTFQLNPPGIGRNAFRGPNYFNVDMTLAKTFGLPGLGILGERANLELKFNFFNLFNTLNLAPFRFFSSGIFVNRPNFGEPDGALAGRSVEFQARFRF